MGREGCRRVINRISVLIKETREGTTSIYYTKMFVFFVLNTPGHSNCSETDPEKPPSRSSVEGQWSLPKRYTSPLILHASSS